MKQSTAKALIISTAKAHGVKSVKGQAENLQAGLGNIRRMVDVIQRRGKGNEAPASQVYKAAELYAIGKAARELMAQVQNVQDDQYGTVRDIKGSLKVIQREANELVGFLDSPKRTAQSVSYWCGDIISTIDSAIKQVQYLMGGNRRVRR